MSISLPPPSLKIVLTIVIHGIHAIVIMELSRILKKNNRIGIPSEAVAHKYEKYLTISAPGYVYV